ncbi:MAG: hypothetical protein Q7R85_02860 [bacterium]|nr:hypothetical protein [bacterium]
MPIFNTKRCRKYFVKECRDFGHETLESLIAERSEALALAAPTPQCVKFPMLVGMEPVTDEVHSAEDCMFCRSVLYVYYFLYITKKELRLYSKVVARRNETPVAAVCRALKSSMFKGGKECLNTGEAMNFDALPPEQQEHRMDCVKCNLRVDLWAVIGNIELRR